MKAGVHGAQGNLRGYRNSSVFDSGGSYTTQRVNVYVKIKTKNRNTHYFQK